MSNLLWRCFHTSNPERTGEDAIGFSHHKSLRSMAAVYREHKPDAVVAVFDRPNSWRKQYTQSEAALTKAVYKGHRREGMTPKQQAIFQMFIESISDFEALLRGQTMVFCLAGDNLEADDLIAGYVRRYAQNENIIVSADKDFIQLLDNPKVSLLDPISGTQRTLDEWGGDAELFLFEKALRGDKGDNVLSAYPRLRSTRIRKAYTDDYERVKLMNETWTLLGEEQRVGDLYEENRMLVDLNAQPDEIRKIMDDVITAESVRERHYKHTAFLRFCGKHKLVNIANEAERFMHMFASPHP